MGDGSRQGCPQPGLGATRGMAAGSQPRQGCARGLKPLCTLLGLRGSPGPPGAGHISWVAPDLGLGVCTASLDPPARLLVWRHPCSGLVPVPGPGGSLHSPHRRFVAFRPAEVGSVPRGRLPSGTPAAGAGSLGTDCRTAPWAEARTCHLGDVSQPCHLLFLPFASRLPPRTSLGPVCCCQPRTAASEEASSETSVLAACLRCLLVFFSPKKSLF